MKSKLFIFMFLSLCFALLVSLLFGSYPSASAQAPIPLPTPGVKPTDPHPGRLPTRGDPERRSPESTGALRGNVGFTTNILDRNDDGSTALVPIGFSLNFFGNAYDKLYVNNNGNVTFDAAQFEYTPYDLTSTTRVIIAPFFADVDTRNTASGVTTYGTDVVNGHSAFGVNWFNVGYYSSSADKLDSFQLVLIDRSDLQAGAFDVEFNYDLIQWETGSASGGSGGLGGFSARVGYSNGSGNPNTFLELSGSATPGSFLDSNQATGLIHNHQNSSLNGRYVFNVRNGVLPPSLDLPLKYLPHDGATFAKLAQNPPGRANGRLNSLFDHRYPDYTTNSEILTWKARVPYSGACQFGVSCYDGHNGIDFQMYFYNGVPEDVLASASGIVLDDSINPLVNNCPEGTGKTTACPPNGNGKNYGNQIWVKHYDTRYATLYGHLKIGTIQVHGGQEITEPLTQPLAKWGNSGYTDGGHVHFGLYYDKNGDGHWTQDEAVDPYGWKPNPYFDDPWVNDQGKHGPNSNYLWHFLLDSPFVSGPATGGSVTSTSGSTQFTIQPNSFASPLFLDLTEGPVSAPSAQLRVTGHSFTVAANLGASSSRLVTSDIVLNPPATINVDYAPEDVTHLAQGNLGVYRWDENNGRWTALSSTVDTISKKVTAQTERFGDFALLAPPICSNDLYEPNDDYSTSGVITTEGQVQPHLIDMPGDQDWVRFNAVAGTTYQIRTSNLDSSMDTVLTLYDQDGATVIVTDDNSGGGTSSFIRWLAAVDGIYFVKVKHVNPSVSGCGFTYNVSISVAPTIPQVFVDKVWTSSKKNIVKTEFHRGDKIRYHAQLSNPSITTCRVISVWKASKTPTKIMLWKGNLNIDPGSADWQLTARIPTNASAGKYTFIVSTVCNGQKSVAKTKFKVLSTFTDEEDNAPNDVAPHRR